jgi:heme-degrading monooxygenase HmoA
MLVAISRFRVPIYEADAVCARCSARSRRVDSHDAFCGLEVLCTRSSDGEFVLVTRWRDKAALAAYLKSDDFRRGASAGRRGGRRASHLRSRRRLIVPSMGRAAE